MCQLLRQHGTLLLSFRRRSLSSEQRSSPLATLESSPRPAALEQRAPNCTRKSFTSDRSPPVECCALFYRPVTRPDCDQSGRIWRRSIPGEFLSRSFADQCLSVASFRAARAARDRCKILDERERYRSLPVTWKLFRKWDIVSGKFSVLGAMVLGWFFPIALRGPVVLGSSCNIL